MLSKENVLEKFRHRCLVLSRINIGECATIGVGVVVTKDVPPGEVAITGNPARPMQQLQNKGNGRGLFR